MENVQSKTYYDLYSSDISQDFLQQDAREIFAQYCDEVLESFEEDEEDFSGFDSEPIDFSNTLIVHSFPHWKELAKGKKDWDRYMDKPRDFVPWPKSYATREEALEIEDRVLRLMDWLLDKFPRKGFAALQQDIRLIRAIWICHDQAIYLSPWNPDGFDKDTGYTKLSGHNEGVHRPGEFENVFYKDPRFQQEDKKRLAKVRNGEKYKAYLKSDKRREQDKLAHKKMRQTPEAKEKDRLRKQALRDKKKFQQEEMDMAAQ